MTVVPVKNNWAGTAHHGGKPTEQASFSRMCLDYVRAVHTHEFSESHQGLKVSQRRYLRPQGRDVD